MKLKPVDLSLMLGLGKGMMYAKQLFEKVVEHKYAVTLSMSVEYPVIGRSYYNVKAGIPDLDILEHVRDEDFEDAIGRLLAIFELRMGQDGVGVRTELPNGPTDQTTAKGDQVPTVNEVAG